VRGRRTARPPGPAPRRTGPTTPPDDTPPSTGGAPHGRHPVTDAEWTNEVLESDKPVLVDFWAEWCGPCRMVSPIVDEIADEHGDKLKVLKLNVDENPFTAREYGIMSIPTLLVFKGGQPTSASSAPRARRRCYRANPPSTPSSPPWPRPSVAASTRRRPSCPIPSSSSATSRRR
jgi:thioredoxin 1